MNISILWRKKSFYNEFNKMKLIIIILANKIKGQAKCQVMRNECTYENEFSLFAFLKRKYDNIKWWVNVTRICRSSLIYYVNLLVYINNNNWSYNDIWMWYVGYISLREKEKEGEREVERNWGERKLKEELTKVMRTNWHKRGEEGKDW